MKREDWIAAGVLAAAVALVVVAAGLPPITWAEDPVRVTIPALPPAELKVPSLDATIKAEATRDPGETVTVTLRCECPAEQAGATVPLVVHVYRNDPASMFSRRVLPAAPKEVTSATCSLFVDSDGKAEAIVELPLTWASDEAARTAAFTTGGYYLVLTSPLVPETKVMLLVNPNQFAAQVTRQQVVR